MATLFEKLASNLLDLGLRNRSLNFKDQKLRSIELIEPDPDMIFDLVRNGETIHLVPSIKENDKEDEKDELLEDEIEDSEFEEDEEEPLRPNEVRAYKRNEKLEHILKNIKKFNDSAIVEKGINVLYLAFGFLKWTEADFSKNELKSPLLLVRVTLDYDKFSRTYSISTNDDEIIVNPTLKAKLENDFGIYIPAFDEEADTFESYLSKYNEILVDHEWSIDDRIYLGIFSFAKLTMYQDLKINNDSMSNQGLIQAIFNGETDKVDRNYDPDYYDEYFKKGKEIYLHNVVDADSSQIEAINEAKTGRSFVIQGPPGTGKSQTITNIIAELLNDGKKVLFVSEKLAALNVVFNNLKRVGLSDYCLQIHSDKTNKKDFVQELYRVLKNPPRGNKGRQEKLEELKRYKQELDSYCEALYKTIPVIDRRPYDILCALYDYKDAPSTSFELQNVSDKNIEYLVERKEILERFALYKGAVPTNYWESPWYGFLGNLYVYDNDKEIKKDLEFIRDFTENITSLTYQLSKNVKLEVSSIEDVKTLKQLLDTLVAIPVNDIALMSKENVEEIGRLLSLLFDSKTKLNKYYDNSLKAFSKDIYKLDILDLYKKFNGEYSSIFRGFNSKYKADAKLLASFKKPEITKVKFGVMKDAVNQAYRYLTAKNDIEESYAKLKELSKFDYSSYSPVQINEILQKFKTYEALLSDDIAYNDDFDFEVVRKSSESLIDVLYNGADFEKYMSLQKYFDSSVIDLNKTALIDIYSKTEKCLKKFEDIKDWSRFYGLLKQLSDYDLLAFVRCCLSEGISADKLKDTYAHAFYKEWLMHIYYDEPVLANFKRANQDHCVRNFCHIDKELFKLSREEIKETIALNIKKFISNQYYTNNNYQKEIILVEHEANKKRAIKPIRYMFKEVPNLIHAVKPCLLMSPLSVATYLAYDNESFDAVIFDEASQIFPWDAIGAIARSKQVIVVGDSKQMPPTNFFQASNDSYEEDYDDEEENASDYESILDLCSACLPQTLLNWHYRSKSESLIAFSNHYLYNDRLVTFPSSEHDSEDFGLDFHYVKNGVFTDRKNLKEAEEVVDLIFDHFKTHPERSLGVVCFSINQQALVEDVLDERRRRNDSFAKFFDQSVDEPFFIKNLETVQGDERDTIIFSIGYGKDHSGVLKHNFGPLNRKGGERRLNVAITRAKYNIKIVSSIRAVDINLNRTGAEGAHLLREYLDVAENGIEVLNRNIATDSNAQADSQFEIEVADVIRKAGYQVDLQVGCSGYRIDICVKHPKVADYVLAVECDGATYHSSRNARDRDRLRQEVLEKLGWKFYRIWSTDWFLNNNTEKEELIKAIEAAVLNYDVKAKSKEEAREKNIEKRFAIIEEKAKEEVEKAKKNSEKYSQSYRGSFFDDADAGLKNLISKFNRDLDQTGYGFIKYNKDMVYAYRMQRDIDNKIVNYWFWFTFAGRTPVFKYRNSPEGYESPSYFAVNEGSNEKLITTVKELISKRFAYPGAQTSTTEDEDNDKEAVLEIYYSIKRRIEGRRLDVSSAEKKLLDEIYDYVMTEIRQYAIEKHYFQNAEEFNEFKYTRRITYNFYGACFTLHSVNWRTAKLIYEQYKVASLITIIQKYEKMFNTKIIDDYNALNRSLLSIVQTKEGSFSSAHGINSNFALVPESVLEDKLKEFDRFE